MGVDDHTKNFELVFELLPRLLDVVLLDHLCRNSSGSFDDQGLVEMVQFHGVRCIAAHDDVFKQRSEHRPILRFHMESGNRSSQMLLLNDLLVSGFNCRLTATVSFVKSRSSRFIALLFCQSVDLNFSLLLELRRRPKLPLLLSELLRTPGSAAPASLRSPSAVMA